MKNRPEKSEKLPALHTLIIGDIRAAWSKMYWDVDAFGDVQRSFPEEHEPLAYLALNACISASSLENWARTRWMQQERKKKFRVKEKDFTDLVDAKIPHQGLCVDVANTTKHGKHEERRWKNGELNFRYDAASEHDPPGFVILKLHESKTSILYNDLHDLPNLWWEFLKEVDLVSGEKPTLEWWQRKISRMFPMILR